MSNRVRQMVIGAALTATVCLHSTAQAQQPIRRVAVMEFQNTTGEKRLDAFTIGIADSISQELAAVPSLVVVERKRIDDAFRELRFGKTDLVQQATVQKAGKVIGADSLVVGSFQKLNDHIRLSAHVVDVATGIVRAPAAVDGNFRDLFAVQSELATRLIIAIQGAISEAERRKFESQSGRSIEAFEAFSRGLYFLQKELAADALNQFDLTLAIDPDYPTVHYYRGVTLEKLSRPDEAIAALKSALSRSEAERQILWSREMPGRGAIVHGMDTIESHLQRDYFALRSPMSFEKQIIYSEPADGATILHFLDPSARSIRRFEIPQPSVQPAAYANDRYVVVIAAESTPGKLPERIEVYGFSKPDLGRLWNVTLTDYRGQYPKITLAGDALCVYYPALLRFDLFDAGSGDLRWKKTGISLDRLERPLLAHTETHGDILIARSDNTYRAIRLSDGQSLWTVTAESAKASELVSDSLLIVFEPEQRVFTVDLESGKVVAEIKMAQYVDAYSTPAGHKWIVGAVLEDSRLYVLSNDLEMWAIDLGAPPRMGTMILWKTPIRRKPQSIRVQGRRLYVGTDTGEVIVMDSTSGAITRTVQVSGQPAMIHCAGANAIIVMSNKAISSLTPEGSLHWEYPWSFPRTELICFKGVVLARADQANLSAIDAESGKLVWQYTAPPIPLIFTDHEKLFVVERSAIKEYSTEKPSQGVSEKETLTRLAEVLLSRGSTSEAAVFAEKALAIDGNYPPARMMHARLVAAQGEIEAAGHELAHYASLVGFESHAGQQAIAELKRNHGLLWQTAIGPAVAGAPVLVGGMLVSVGHRVGYESQIVALDPRTGEVPWRRKVERFASSVTGTLSGRSYLWYIGGLRSDFTTVILYRVDILSGVSREIARWKNGARVHEAWMVYASGHVFVATASADAETGNLRIAIRGIDAGTGMRLWEKNHEFNASLADPLHPTRMSPTGEDALTYWVGQNRQTVRVVDGASLPPIEVEDSAKPVDPVPANFLLWTPSALLVQAGRLYAFTADGRAYAVLTGSKETRQK